MGAQPGMFDTEPEGYWGRFPFHFPISSFDKDSKYSPCDTQKSDHSTPLLPLSTLST